MPPFNRERGKPSEPDRAMWRFALLTCREADATSRVRNLMVIGAVVAGAFARILAPVVLGLGLEFALQGAWWRWGLPAVAVLYAAIWWLGSAGRACFLPTYGRLEQAMQSRFMVRALECSNRSDPRARGRVDESTVGFAIDSAASALREGLSCLHLSLLPAGVSILAGTATVGLVGGIGVLAVFLATVLVYAAISTPLIRRHQRLQTLFFKEAMRSFGVLVNLLSLWRETRIFDGHAHARQWYRRDRSRVERRAMRSYRATRGLQVSQALVLAAGIAVALCLFARAGEPPSLGVTGRRRPGSTRRSTTPPGHWEPRRNHRCGRPVGPSGAWVTAGPARPLGRNGSLGSEAWPTEASAPDPAAGKPSLTCPRNRDCWQARSSTTCVSDATCHPVPSTGSSGSSAWGSSPGEGPANTR